MIVGDNEIAWDEEGSLDLLLGASSECSLELDFSAAEKDGGAVDSAPGLACCGLLLVDPAVL